MVYNTALLVIDVQNGILAKGVFKEQQLLENINSLIDWAHDQRIPVYFIRHTDSGLLQQGTEPWQVSNALHAAQDDIFFDKHHSSVFKEAAFPELLEAKSIDALVVTGLVTNGCVQAGCMDALSLGYKLTLISDAHSTYHQEAEKLIAQWNNTLSEEGAEVLTAKQFLKG